MWLMLVVLVLSGRLAASPKPNVILVMPDDVGWGDFACHGNPVARTPAVDGFWREAVRFTDFHVSPTCAPTRAALLTGRHEFKNGVTHTIDERERLAPGARTLAEVLRGAGYATGLFGKWHLGDERDRWPDRRGFDEFFIHGAGGIGQSYPGSCGDAPGNTNFDPVILHNGKFEKTRGYCTDVFFERAMAWIQSAKDRGPFFAMITPNAAHAPLDVPDSFAKRHRGEVNEMTAKFYGMIENIDENFGRLLAKLKEWDLEASTLVVFLTDNGGTVGVPLFNGGRRGTKGTPYEGGTRVPSLWRWPGGFGGGRDVDVLTAHLDILPTLADFAGASLDDTVARQVEGRSLRPLLMPGAAADPVIPWADRTFITHVGRWPQGQAAAFKHTGCSIRDARFSLVNNTELFDLRTDSGQQTNVIDAHPDVVARLRSAYDAWWDSLPPLLVNEDAVPPAENAFAVLFREQFGDSPPPPGKRSGP